MNNRIALDPENSVVVEACAGSGKTWLLVSRIVRLLLNGTPPGEILAITFTRKAAQEMQARLRDWLYELASQDDDQVRRFLLERAVAESDIAPLLPRARSLYQQYLLVQPGIAINTFHGWFMQILQRAPLNTCLAGGVNLVEQVSALKKEAWQIFIDGLHGQPDSETAQAMLALFEEMGLSNTRQLLFAFLAKRSEWWAYTNGQENALCYALEQLRHDFGVTLDADPIIDACADKTLQTAVHAFAQVLATGTETQCNMANKIQNSWEIADVHLRFADLSRTLYTQAGNPRSFKPTKKQDAETFLLAHEALFDKLQSVRNTLTEQRALRMNKAALRCGATLLDTYQKLKQRQQLLDFGDLEWRVCQLLNDSDHAEYMQYKLDSRYRHVLLDEFQDTNPLQWQILQAWFAASDAVDTHPTVFVVGDPKQSIYRFRRADARLFDVVRKFLQDHYNAHHLTQNETRRNAPVVLDAVNGVFDGLAEFSGFEKHHAHQHALPGHVEVLPLIRGLETEDGGQSQQSSHPNGLHLRNPLLDPYPDREAGAREQEAHQFAEKIEHIVGLYHIRNEAIPDGIVQSGNSHTRPVQFSDIMVLVRRRTHLKVYEHALRARHIPYLTSRRGGLLDTLEAADIQALLTFLIAPFADLQLAHTLRTPIFSCNDDDLMGIADCGNPHPIPPPEGEGTIALSPSGGKMDIGLRIAESESRIADCGANTISSSILQLPQSAIRNPQSPWWVRLQYMATNGATSPALMRAYRLLQGWLELADKLPVHDLLDRIYFEGDVQNRYAAAAPDALRTAVLANLQAFMEQALNVDAGRYPSLPGFLRELAELRRAGDDEAPDEGRVSQAGNALRIYTVHEAKGLEAPVVWLLDSNIKQPADKGYDVLLDWPTGERQPAHFSLYCDKANRGKARSACFEQEAILAQREDLNLLYVAMTRARQMLLVSGSGERIEGSWYDRIAASEDRGQKTESRLLCGFAAPLSKDCRVAATKLLSSVFCPPSSDAPSFATGKRTAHNTIQQQRGIWLHALLQHLLTPIALTDKLDLQQRFGVPAAEFDVLLMQAQRLIKLPHLQRFFDPQHRAWNEMPYVNMRGEMKRIDRLVEFAAEVWVLDYKLGDSDKTARYSTQMEEYRSAMQSVYTNKKVRCALLFADGTLIEM